MKQYAENLNNKIQCIHNKHLGYLSSANLLCVKQGFTSLVSDLQIVLSISLLLADYLATATTMKLVIKVTASCK